MAEQAGQLRLLIATDNHLGVWEDDEIRKHDSFVAFEEILQHAHRLRVDALLLGGDLFHENKPSRPTVVRTIQLLRKYVMNDNPVNIQVLSDQASNFSLNTRVNYEEDNYNVGLPIFIIHGNHDEPAGADNLSAIDILAACNLVNYYGKTARTPKRSEKILGRKGTDAVPACAALAYRQGMSGAGAGKFQVDIAPVLIQKGDTRLALYGLGYMRDSRLYRMMTTTGDVTWRRPADAPGAPADSWFNLFFIHQNHAQRGSKSAVSEKQLPKWLNLVVWGHEHASKTEPTPSSEGTFDVSQPGSSVHTTLSEDEARPKKILLLTLKGEDWKTETLQLRTVRPFVFENVALRDEPTLASRPDDAEGVSRFLHAAVEAAIVRANAQATEFDGAGGASAPPPDATAGGAAAPPAVLPLVRVRVDHSGGFPTVPLQRFGAAFQGRVANPWDLLQFHKCATKRAKMERGSGAEAAAAAAEEAPGTGEANEHRRIDALVTQHLPAQLQILTEADMALALEDFVQRDEKNALADAVKAALDESQRKVAAHGMPAGAVDDPSEVLKTIKVVVQEMNAAKPARAKPARAADADGAGAEGGDVDMTGEDDAPPARAKTAAKPRAKAAAAKPKAAKGKQATVAGLFGRATATATADGDGGAAASEEPSPAKRPPARRAAAAKKTYAESDEDGDADGDEDFAAGKRGASEDESDGDDAIDEDAEESPRPKRKAAPAARGAGRGKGKAAASGAGAKRGRAAVEEPVEIEDSDDDDAPKPKAARGAARAAPPSVAASAPSQPQTNATATARGWGSMRR